MRPGRHFATERSVVRAESFHGVGRGGLVTDAGMHASGR
jgi:hypothetical protein